MMKQLCSIFLAAAVMAADKTGYELQFEFDLWPACLRCRLQRKVVLSVTTVASRLRFTRQYTGAGWNTTYEKYTVNSSFVIVGIPAKMLAHKSPETNKRSRLLLFEIISRDLHHDGQGIRKSGRHYDAVSVLTAKPRESAEWRKRLSGTSPVLIGP